MSEIPGPPSHVLVMDMVGKWPVVHAHDVPSGDIVGEWRTDVAEPDLSVLDGSTHVGLIDVLEHVLDEEYWLRTVRTLIRPGGTIAVRVPAEGQLSWLDALNIYRYVADLTGRGHEPRAAHPTGWHRHYRRKDLSDLIERSGFALATMSRSGIWHREVCRLVRLLAGDARYDHLVVVRELFGTPPGLTWSEPTLPGGLIGSCWVATANVR